MTIQVSLAGITSAPAPEDRTLAYLTVVYNGTTYDWRAFVPTNHLGDLNSFIESAKPAIQAEIDEKEAEWAALNPKTRVIESPFGGEPQTVAIEKNEIVQPNGLDYFAKRRSEYTPIGDQLDAMLRGYDSPEYQEIIKRHLEIKTTNYKLPRTLESVKLAKKTELNLFRDKEEIGGFLFLGKVFDSDYSAIKRISIVSLAAAVAPEGFTIDWTTRDGSVITLTKADIAMMPLVMAGTANALHIKAKTLKNQVDAALTIEAVNNISW